MQKSDVFFSDMRAKPGNSMLDKLVKLVRKAGIETIDFNRKFVALKIHFGEPGNVSYIRPNYVKPISRIIAEKGGRPFLTDANTLYKGRRDNAVSHLEAAYENGFSEAATGCRIIIADGLRGLDYREIPLSLKNCKSAKIASAIADAEIIVSMNHFKGHEMTGFGGCLKNLGMGSGSIGGKLEMHSSSKPKISSKKCVGCRMCEKNCNVSAITIVQGKAVINYDKCIGCGQCVAVCQYGAAMLGSWDSAGSTVDEKIAEYALAVVKGKPCFHINFIMNVSPNCDCWSMNDAAVIPDIGILASMDPVALDKASIDLVNESPIIRTSCLEAHSSSENLDKFTCIHPKTDWRLMLSYAEKIGLGNQEYNLVKCD